MPILGLTGRNLAFLSLRLWLGVRALVTGLEKFAGTITVQEPMLDAAGQPDPSGAMLDVQRKVYGWGQYHAMPDTLQAKLAAEPLMPESLMKLFCACLGPALVLVGLALLIGLASRCSLMLMGVIYLALTVGLILIGQDQGVAFLGIHLGLIALALTLVDHDRFAITRRL
jgi:thiosulfate dehydrogenase [quinone] large subunit